MQKENYVNTGFDTICSFEHPLSVWWIKEDYGIITMAIKFHHEFRRR